MNTPETHEFYDLAVIGGGLAGLYAAARAAREGKRVVLYEAGTKLGGRGRSPALSDGVVANLGPRGLYRGGQAERAFKALGVSFHGGRPPASGSYRLGGDLFAFPSMAAMAMPMLAGGDGPVDGKALRGVRKAVFSARSESKAPEDARTVGQWLDEKDIRGTARKF
ncbi:MAG: FAD/NAD(P)-binding protein, partial [Myxococcota bacterium]